VAAILRNRFETLTACTTQTFKY